MNRASRRLAAVQNQVHLFRNGHLDLISASETDRSIGSEHSLSDHPVHTSDDIRQLATATEFHAQAAIAG
jgi:hypothetical protein